MARVSAWICGNPEVARFRWGAVQLLRVTVQSTGLIDGATLYRRSSSWIAVIPVAHAAALHAGGRFMRAVED